MLNKISLVFENLFRLGYSHLCQYHCIRIPLIISWFSQLFICLSYWVNGVGSYSELFTFNDADLQIFLPNWTHFVTISTDFYSTVLRLSKCCLVMGIVGRLVIDLLGSFILSVYTSSKIECHLKMKKNKKTLKTCNNISKRETFVQINGQSWSNRNTANFVLMPI